MMPRGKRKKPTDEVIDIAEMEPPVTHKAVKGTTPDEIVNGADEPTITVTDAQQPQPVRVFDWLDVVRLAWDSVRGDDPAFDDCSPDFKSTLLYHAAAVRNTGGVQEGDSPIARFEQALAQLIKESQ